MKYKLDRKGSERIVKDLNLKDIHLGRIEGKLTGDPFIDKPWAVRYPDIETLIDVNDTMYNNYMRYAEEHLDDIAIYLPVKDKTYTHRELVEMIKTTMKKLKNMGIGENSRVAALQNGGVEEAVILIACSGLGSILKPIDFLKAPETMAHSVMEFKPDMFFMDEMFLGAAPFLNPGNLPTVVTDTDKEIHNDNLISFNKLLEEGRGIAEDVEPYPYSQNKTSLIISSSGTTGNPKPIKHSDYKANVAALKVLYTGYPIKRGNVLLKMMPMQLGIGIITSLYTALVSGATVTMIGGTAAPDLGAKMINAITRFGEFKEKYGYDKDAKMVLFSAPVFFKILLSCPEVKDLSCLGAIMLAGSKMDEEYFKGIPEAMKEKNCIVPACNAYGQNEQLGAVSFNTVEFNQNTSAGTPAIGTDIRIVNPDTLEPVGLNEEGLILEDSDTNFLGYEGMEQATMDAYVTLPDGSLWFNSNDLGKMDSDYYLHITGRLTRVVIRSDFKFSLDDIESKIRKVPGVIDCAIIVTSKASSWEDYAVFIKTDKSIEEISELLKTSGVLSQFEIPTEVIEIDELPYLGAGKVDYVSLQKSYDNKGQLRALRLQQP